MQIQIQLFLINPSNTKTFKLFKISQPAREPLHSLPSTGTEGGFNPALSPNALKVQIFVGIYFRWDLFSQTFWAKITFYGYIIREWDIICYFFFIFLHFSTHFGWDFANFRENAIFANRQEIREKKLKNFYQRKSAPFICQ